MKRGRRRRGFSILSALFLVVVLSALGSVMLRISGIAQRTTIHTLMGARAYYAARSGLEWGIRQALDAGACPADASFALSEAGSAGFQLFVTCTSTRHAEGGTESSVYQILSTAEHGSFGSRDYIRRRVQGTFTDAP